MVVNSHNRRNIMAGFRPNMFSINVNPNIVNYKLLKTGSNDPQMSCRMKYSNVARNSTNFYKYPMCNLKNPNTGIANPVQYANVQTVYFNQSQSAGPIQNQPQQASYTRFLCTKQ